MLFTSGASENFRVRIVFRLCKWTTPEGDFAIAEVSFALLSDSRLSEQLPFFAFSNLAWENIAPASISPCKFIEKSEVAFGGLQFKGQQR